jgi:hypothetical protein
MRDVLAVPWGRDWPIVKRELARCAELGNLPLQDAWRLGRQSLARPSIDWTVWSISCQVQPAPIRGSARSSSE